MSLLKTVKPEEAEGLVAEVYKPLMEMMGMVPAPLQLYSASPNLMVLQKKVMDYFMSHPNLNAGLLALIRLLVAEELQYNYCISLNKTILKMIGIADDDHLAEIMANPDKAPLEEKDIALLKLVIKVCTKPDSVEEEDVQKARDLGWQESDIFDAIMHGMSMVVGGLLEKAVGLPEGAAC